MRIEVCGIPAPQGSKRHVGGGRMVEQSRAVGPWREAVRAETQRAVASDHQWFAGTRAPVRVALRFRLHRGTTVRRPFPTAKRDDLDKLIRAVLDGITTGGAIADDGQVIMINAWKRYAIDGGKPPGVTILIEEADDDSA